MITPIFITVIVRKSDFDKCGFPQATDKITDPYVTDGQLVAHYCMSNHASEYYCNKLSEKLGCKPDDPDRIAIFELMGGGFLWPCDWLKTVETSDGEFRIQLIE